MARAKYTFALAFNTFCMSKLLLFFGILFSFTNTLTAQFPDNNWVLGHSAEIVLNDSFGLILLNFANNDLNFSEELNVIYTFQENNSAISYNDTLQFYFNGQTIKNNQHENIVNGEDMYIGQSSSGDDNPQASLILPSNDIQPEYYLLTTDLYGNEELATLTGENLRYSVIDMNAAEGQGEVIMKNELILTHPTLEGSKLTAVRHANGRDWWVIYKYYDESKFIVLLWTSEGFQIMPDQTIGEDYPTGLGQAAFSPDGSKYAVLNSISADAGEYLAVYDFDRCSGLLRDQILILQAHNGFGGGVAFSPNGRYLYASSGLTVYQYDLWAEDLEASRITIAETDGSDPNRAFYLQQLARNGKIYMSGYGFSNALNVIEYPDRHGPAATVTTLELPVHNAYGIPNFPNHRLGPLDGSSCDTLGIDNLPLANFRTDQDTSDYLAFYFQDLSAYEPTDWVWDFGDGGTSQDTSPVHTYTQDGIYEVCLTVSNDNGSDTSCQTVQVGTVSTEAPPVVVDIRSFPNPFRDQFSVVFNEYYPRRAVVTYYTLAGQRIHRQRLFHGWNTVDGSTWPSGVYFYEVWDGDQRVAGGKVVRVE
jgi:PKD repeat protein